MTEVSYVEVQEGPASKTYIQPLPELLPRGDPGDCSFGRPKEHHFPVPFRGVVQCNLRVLLAHYRPPVLLPRRSWFRLGPLQVPRASPFNPLPPRIANPVARKSWIRPSVARPLSLSSRDVLSLGQTACVTTVLRPHLPYHCCVIKLARYRRGQYHRCHTSRH